MRSTYPLPVLHRRKSAWQLSADTAARLIATTAALDGSASLIDSYLMGRYALPLFPVPKLLVGIGCDLTRYALFSDAAPPIIKDRHDAAMAQLRDLAAGRARLEVDMPPDVPAGRVVLVSAERLFSREGR